MSQEELTRLAEQKRLLQEQLNALAEQERKIHEEEAEAERQKELTKPIKIVANKVSGSMVSVYASEFRNDVVQEFRNTNGRAYRGSAENLVPVKEFENLCKRLEALPNVTVEVTDEVTAKIDRLLNAPVWAIDMNMNGVTLTPGPYVSQWIMKDNFSWKQISGSAEEPVFQIPASEAWRIPTVMVMKKTIWNQVESRYDEITEPLEGVVYSEAVKLFIEAQLENRAQLDQIAQLKDAPEIQEQLNALGWNGELYPFQRVGVKFGQLTNGKFILSDEVGLGKTWQALALAVIEKKQRILCVVPASLKPNWVREIKNRTGEDAIVLKGGDPKMWVADLMFKKWRFVVMNYDILAKRIDTEEIVQNDWGGYSKNEVTTWPAVDFLKMMNFDMIAFDEGHYLKNTSSNRSQAARKLANEVTGSPFTVPMTGHPVMNRPNELHPLLQMVNPGQFGSQEKFEQRYSPDGKTIQNAAELHELVKPIFLRRRKKDIFKELPPIQRITEYCELSDKARKAYLRAEAGLYRALAEYSPYGQEGEGDMHIMSILAKITRLKQICAADKCERSAELATELFDSAEEGNGPRKILIFTQYKGTAYKIHSMLQPNSLCFVKRTMHGKKADFHTVETQERDDIIQQFQNDPDINYLVVTEKATREGHNITAAGTVIFNDLFWTPAAHEQAEGRAYGRIGDMHGINSHWLVCEDSLETWIMELLAQKLAVIQETVEGVETSRHKDISIAKELISKIREQMWIRKGKGK